MKKVKRTISIAFLAIAICSSSSADAQKIEIGMTKAQLAKAFPAYTKEFNSKKASADIEDFRLHGMTGDATFQFANGRLFLFDWQHYKQGVPIDQETTRQYVMLVQKLRTDWGPGNPKPSVYNMDVLDCTWNDPHWSASIKYSPLAIKVQLIDLDAEHRMIGR